MAKGLYIGVDNIARKVTKMYIGVDGVARRIKKAYIGIGGVARPLLSTGPIEYWGATNSSVEGYELSATTVSNFALFGVEDSLDAYDTSLTRSSVASLSPARIELAATTVGSYALFGGGWKLSDTSTMSSAVDAYNTSLTRTTATPLSEARRFLAATTVGNYALFGGGDPPSGTDSSSTVDAYNTSLTRTTATPLSTARYELAATTVGDYALFGGGSISTYEGDSNLRSTVDAYNTSLTRTTATPLSTARYAAAATTVGDYALFGGGRDVFRVGVRGASDTLDAYNLSLTRTTATPLSTARYELAATTLCDYALFGGGTDVSNVKSRSLDAYDTSLTRSSQSPLSTAILAPAATTLCDYALFGNYGTIDIYKLHQPI